MVIESDLNKKYDQICRQNPNLWEKLIKMNQDLFETFQNHLEKIKNIYFLIETLENRSI